MNNEMASNIKIGARRRSVRELEDQRDEDIEQARVEAGADIKAHQTPPEPSEDEGEVIEGMEAEESQLWDDTRSDCSAAVRHMKEEIKDIEKDSLDQIQSLRDALTLLDEKSRKASPAGRRRLSEAGITAGRALADKLDRNLRLNDPAGEDCSLGPGRCGDQGAPARRSTWTSSPTTCGHEIAQTQGPRRARAIKRLEVAEAFLSRPSLVLSG